MIQCWKFPRLMSCTCVKSGWKGQSEKPQFSLSAWTNNPNHYDFEINGSPEFLLILLAVTSSLCLTAMNDHSFHSLYVSPLASFILLLQTINHRNSGSFTEPMSQRDLSLLKLFEFTKRLHQWSEISTTVICPNSYKAYINTNRLPLMECVMWPWPSYLIR